MTVSIVQAVPLVELAAQKLQVIHRRVLHTFDAFAEARMRKAVPLRQLRRAQREIERCRRLIRGAAAAKAPRR